MTRLGDPVQRHIVAIMVRDTIVPDDASDMTPGGAFSVKKRERFLRAMLATTDFSGTPEMTMLDDPVGRRTGRVAFNPAIRSLWEDGAWTGHGPAPHRLPEDAGSIRRFIRQQTHLHPGNPDSDAADGEIERLLGFKIADHARIADLLREGGPSAQLFVAASMLSAACLRFYKAQARGRASGRHKPAVDAAARVVQAALIGTARLAAAFQADDSALPHAGRLALYLASQVERYRGIAQRQGDARAVSVARAAADAVHLALARGIVHEIPAETDRDPARLQARLAVGNVALETAVQAMLDEIAAVDPREVYLLLMALRLDAARARHPWLAAPHPLFRLSYAYIGGNALFAELERLGAILSAMARRRRDTDDTLLDNRTIRPILAQPLTTHEAIDAQTAAGRYLDLGAYHRAVMTSFIRKKAHWLNTTVEHYTHHAYAKGSRFCDLAKAASDTATHSFIRRSELDKPTQAGTRRQNLVLFYGLDIQEVAILGLRQILMRLSSRGAERDEWRIAFGRTVHRILGHTAPDEADALAGTSFLHVADITPTGERPTCKGIANRATALARRFDDRDYDAPCGAGFDYALWFDRDRDVDFWDRLQKGAKLYTKFGSAFIPALSPSDREPLPGRRGRAATPANAPPSRWRAVMIEARKAFDAYLPLYLRSRPSRLTARIMARMSQGYSALASDPQFRILFRA